MTDDRTYTLDPAAELCLCSHPRHTHDEQCTACDCPRFNTASTPIIIRKDQP